MRGTLRVDPSLPEVGVRARIDVRLSVDIDVGEGAIGNSYRRHARLRRGAGWHGYECCDGDERDEKLQNSCFFKVSQLIHGSWFLSFPGD